MLLCNLSGLFFFKLNRKDLTDVILLLVSFLQEFCFFAMVCLLSDFFLQMVLFVTVLSIDIRRMEVLDDHVVLCFKIILKRANNAMQGIYLR